MGNCNFSQESESNTTMSKGNFQFHYLIGKGGFSKVWKIEKKKTREFFALKEMSKSKIITKRSVVSIMNERHLLSSLKHPFLVNMIFAFQDRDNLYLVMDMMSGGDLRHHLTRKGQFSETQSKFFICSILVCLEYLHSNGIMHRDIKPENLLLDKKGYLRVTDLGIARLWTPDNADDSSGTPGYMAPEVMCRQNHGVAVDYYSLGVLCYEFMLGRRPYYGNSKKEIRDSILSKQVQIKKTEIPDGWSLESADFINRLIQRKPVNRLGLNGPKEVKEHPWIKDFPWKKLIDKELEAPYIPNRNEEHFDLKNLRKKNAPFEETTDINKQNKINLRKGEVQKLFEGYDFDSNYNQSSQSLKSNNSPLNTNSSTKKSY